MAQQTTLAEVRARRVTNGNGRLILTKQLVRSLPVLRPTPRILNPPPGAVTDFVRPFEFPMPILVADPVKRIFPILRFDPRKKTPGFVPPTKRPGEAMNGLPVPTLPDRSRVGCPGCGLDAAKSRPCPPGSVKVAVGSRSERCAPMARPPMARTADFQFSGVTDAQGRPVDARDVTPAMLVASTPAEAAKFNLLQFWPLAVVAALVVLGSQDKSPAGRPGPVFCGACKAIKSRRGPCKRCAKRKGG